MLWEFSGCSLCPCCPGHLLALAALPTSWPLCRGGTAEPLSSGTEGFVTCRGSGTEGFVTCRGSGTEGFLSPFPLPLQFPRPGLQQTQQQQQTAALVRQLQKQLSSKCVCAQTHGNVSERGIVFLETLCLFACC